ncbi:MAG TPA: RluA family pseudouridine synthase [Thermodesulfobacteriota bacterium]
MNKEESHIERFQISQDLSGKRADVAISYLLTSVTRSQIKRMFEEGLVLIDGKPVKPSKKLSKGESVSVTFIPPKHLDVTPQDIPVTILYEDEDIIVVNKPAGMTVHPGAGMREGTLVNALLYKCSGLSGIGGKLRPGIVHRLDKDTSGVMVVAKNDLAHRSLVEQFKSRETIKKYLALVVGDIKLESGSFSSVIGRNPKDRKRMSTKVKTGKEALTLWRVIRRYKNVTMVEVEPKTGRTHQIRVHFAENNYPLLGDKVYGLKKQKSQLAEEISTKLGRQALHALTLSFKHPRTGVILEFSAPIPDDINAVINLLEK